ncbi:MAG: ABC transporter ATP-binding protein [Actinobacteria bacterium]|nr:ABC transporter ATP-binding protein [Actinomycetota bacterium]
MQGSLTSPASRPVGGPVDRAETAPALRCRGVRKTFGDAVAVAELDLDVPSGSITALLGPSGCGKTTALRLIAGLESPDVGTITIDGVEVAGADGEVPPEVRQVGMVFQDYALFPHLTVERNVDYGLRGRDRGERREATRRALQLVGMEAYGGRLPHELSGGQRQRIALARALAPGPQLVLLDEPFSNLDAAMRASVREEVRTILKAASATAVFVTHDQEEALSLADEVAVMAEGRIHQTAPPHVLYATPRTRFVAEFVGDADVLPGRRAGRYFIDTPIGRLPTAGEVEADRADAVLRPESVRVRPRPDGPVRVTAVTFFGHDQLVHLQLADGTTLRSRQGPELRVVAGDRVDIEVVGPVAVFPTSATAADDHPVPA